jgi:phosphoribosylglycinamide formyltransferase-1
MPHKVAIFASGSGTNAQAIIDYFAQREDVQIALIASNNSNALVMDMD